ncbi:hypothetical protein Droror1_Dr00003972 [Drosera rotundifolia]
MLIHAYYRAQKIKARKNNTSTRGTSYEDKEEFQEGPDGKKSGYESSLRALGGRSFRNRPSSFSSTQASSGSGGGGASGAMKGLPKEAISSNRNNSGEASRASSTKGTKNLKDAEVTNPMGRSETRQLILDPSAKRRILEELQSEVGDMLTPAGMMDAGRTGDDADAGSP